MHATEDEDELLRSTALQTATSIMLARQRAEEELLRTRETLRASEERLRAIFNQAAVGIAIAGLDGRLLDMNAKFCEVLGYSEQELRTMSFHATTHPDDLPATVAGMAALLGGTQPGFRAEKRYRRKDGSIVWSLTTVSVLRDARGEPYQLIGVVEDITDRVRAEEAARRAADERQVLLTREREAREAAERLSDLKDEFLATMSHELRTPLNAILGWAQMLRSRPSGQADMEKGLATIERNARLQTQLIDDLLDMSRISTGTLRLDVRPLQPVTVVEAAMATVEPAANAKGVRVESMLDAGAGPVNGDPARLQQVVWNMLSNAIKFTPRGGRVQITLARADSHVRLEVCDTGIGVAPEFLPHVFERFRQGDAATTRQYGGLGLGLAIVKRLVELHGGTVSIASPGEGQGTTVTVLLPVALLRPAAETRGPRLQVPASDAVLLSADLSGVTILAVDDEEDARELIAHVLTQCGAQVYTAASAADAVTLVERHRPDVLISDIGMPGTDGYELLKGVRALGAERGGRVPAVALTAFARSEDRMRALRAGFLVHVAKPVEPSELVATVATVAGRAG